MKFLLSRAKSWDFAPKEAAQLGKDSFAEACSGLDDMTPLPCQRGQRSKLRVERMPPVFGKRLERRAEAPTLLGRSAAFPGERWSAEWLTFREMTVLIIKINCIALTSVQARLTMMFA